VAPIKLAAHLLLAFTVFGVILWTRWQVMGHLRRPTARGIALGARALLALVVVQIALGALVAGLRAGLTYNTYPLMDGVFIPGGLHLLSPWWLNHLESPLTVQFQHRMGAIAVMLASIGLVAYAWRYRDERRLLAMLLGTITLQFALGVATLLSGVHIWLASAHQLAALLLIGILLRLIYRAPLAASA
jgi:cytochrome c oxidase assembly protein subunit 15